MYSVSDLGQNSVHCILALNELIHFRLWFSTLITYVTFITVTDGQTYAVIYLVMLECTRGVISLLYNCRHSARKLSSSFMSVNEHLIQLNLTTFMHGEQNNIAKI